MSKQIEQEINHQRDIKNNIWTALIVTLGGTITLVLGVINIFKLILFVIGLLLSTILFLAYFNKQDTVSHLINKLKE